MSSCLPWVLVVPLCKCLLVVLLDTFSVSAGVLSLELNSVRALQDLLIFTVHTGRLLSQLFAFLHCLFELRLCLFKQLIASLSVTLRKRFIRIEEVVSQILVRLEASAEHRFAHGF